jgi:transposase-like protein
MEALQQEFLPMADVSQAISNLQSEWHHLHNLDRAGDVEAICEAGASLRELAKALNRSPTLLRHLRQAAQAPRGDRYPARAGSAATNSSGAPELPGLDELPSAARRLRWSARKPLVLPARRSVIGCLQKGLLAPMANRSSPKRGGK